MNEAQAPVDGALYAARQKIYPRDIKGRFQRLRVYAVFALLGLYYVLPWIRWGERQAVLFDLPARKFHIFALTLWPQDFYFLTWLLIIAALALFFFTALAGRLFCGYACPQTVWTETFVWIERWVEGSRTQQMKLARAPLSGEKILRKGTKYFLWFAFALWTGFTFVGYFTPITELAGKIASFSTGPWETFWVLFYGGATYVNAGFMREQVCKYMCPYARFQSAMFDRDTLIIAYDPMRGEPRGPRRRGLADVIARGRGLLDKRAADDYVFHASQHPSAAAKSTAARGTITFDQAFEKVAPLAAIKPEQIGDCVDCTICVQVCPTGIDIRNGLQYECIGCAACIDGCNQVMDKMGYAQGLIRYTTENALANGYDNTTMWRRVFRVRTLVYTGLLATIVAAVGVSLYLREALKVDVIRDRAALARETVPGMIENVYRLQIMNTDETPRRISIAVDGVPGMKVAGVELPLAIAGASTLLVPLRVQAPAGAARPGAVRIEFVIATADDAKLVRREKSTFLFPR
jgi:polyferredoxin